ncbi:MAG: DUF58 domain-containing protein, partial [Actinomycetales bacterium]
EYIPGDDHRDVHWRSTAHLGTLMVRQFEDTRRAHLLVIFDTRASSWASENEFETGVSVAASLALATIRDSKETSVITTDGLLHTPTATQLLDRFTELTTATEQLPLHALAASATEQIPGASVVILVTGSTLTIKDLQLAWLPIPVDMMTIAIRCAENARPARKKIRGFNILTVGELADLSLAMRRIL